MFEVEAGSGSGGGGVAAVLGLNDGGDVCRGEFAFAGVEEGADDISCHLVEESVCGNLYDEKFYSCIKRKLFFFDGDFVDMPRGVFYFTACRLKGGKIMLADKVFGRLFHLRYVEFSLYVAYKSLEERVFFAAEYKVSVGFPFCVVSAVEVRLCD